MSQNLVDALVFLGLTVAALLPFFLFLKWMEKKENLKRDNAVVNLSLIMSSASREDLRFAEVRLMQVGFDFFCKGMIRIPKYFWDCKEPELMANTLRTCGKILTSHAADKEETFLNFSNWLGNLLLDKTRYNTDTAKALAVLSSICSSDRKLAANLTKYMFMASLSAPPPVVWAVK